MWCYKYLFGPPQSDIIESRLVTNPCWDANVRPMELIDPRAGFLDATCYWPHAIALLICSHQKVKTPGQQPCLVGKPEWFLLLSAISWRFWERGMSQNVTMSGVATTRGIPTVLSYLCTPKRKWSPMYRTFIQLSMIRWYYSAYIICLQWQHSERKTWGLDQPAVSWAGELRLRCFQWSYQVKPQKYVTTIQNT